MKRSPGLCYQWVLPRDDGPRAPGENHPKEAGAKAVFLLLTVRVVFKQFGKALTKLVNRPTPFDPKKTRLHLLKIIRLTEHPKSRKNLSGRIARIFLVSAPSTNLRVQINLFLGLQAKSLLTFPLPLASPSFIDGPPPYVEASRHRQLWLQHRLGELVDQRIAASIRAVGRESEEKTGEGRGSF